MDKFIGMDLGRYHILEPLGEGGMATVYKAFDTRLEREVALKFIRVDQFAPAILENVLKRFEREAKSLARLSHPNIVKVLDYADYEGSPYLVMEYLPGGTLKDLVGKPISWKETFRYLIPVAQALEYAHKHNIIHRDIKPSNILLTENGQTMLSDFGIAKILEGDGSATLTGTGVGVGTPEYMAPEQWSGQAGIASDIYSFGIVLYELVTGCKPYTAETPAAVLLKQATEPLQIPSQLVSNLPDGVEKILLKALAKKPENRYPTMSEFVQAMENLLVARTDSSAIEKPPSEEATTIGKPAADARAEETLLAGIPPAVGSGQNPQSTPGPEIIQEKTILATERMPAVASPGPARKHKRWLVWVGGILLLLIIGVVAVTFFPRGSKPAAEIPPATGTQAANANLGPTSTELPAPVIPPATSAPLTDPAAAAIQALTPACKQEGMLTIIATPPDWANYGEIINLFEKTTGLKINSLAPNAGSADELAAIEANKGSQVPQAPDIVDIGYTFIAKGITAGDFQPYKVSTWDNIPEKILGIPAKDPKGLWTGGYYGVISILVNTAVVKNVPSSWADLLKPEYKGKVALPGDPRSSNQATMAVLAASLANGGSLDNALPGLDWFNQLNKVGNFVPVIAKTSTIAQGVTPITFLWDYNAFGYRDEMNGNPPETVIYLSPTVASMYVQAISAYAPHLNCAKLWLEMLHSDQGQLAWMKGYAHGVQQADLETRGVIPPDLKAKLPASSTFSSALSPTPDQLTAALNLIKTGWMTTVGVSFATPAP